MKKILSILFIIIILMATFVSCDDKEQQAINSAPDSTTNPSVTQNQEPVQPPKEDNYSKGLEFSLSDDGNSYIVTGIGTCTDVDLIIPDTYNNLPVLDIGENAFKDNPSIQSISTGNSVTNIGAYAFQNCASLKNIYLLDSLVSIQDYAFENCYTLSNLYGGKNFKEFTFTVFYGCYELANIEIDKENPYYTSIDGSFYSKDETILIRYAVGKRDTQFTIPDTVVAIGEQSFYGAAYLTNVIIPSGVTSIGASAFGQCSALEQISVPITVNSIGSAAFSGDKSLKIIKYEGAVEDWQKISKLYWALGMGEYNVACTDGTINHLGWVITITPVNP